MAGSDKNTSSGPYGFDILKSLQNAAKIVAELSPPRHVTAPFVEGPYGLPMAPFMSPLPIEANNITEKLGDQSKVMPESEKSETKRKAPKRAQSDDLLLRAFSVKSLNDLSNPSTDHRSSSKSSKAKKDQEKRKKTRSNRLCALIQDGKFEALPEAITAIEDRRRRKAAKSKRNLLRKSASADCVTHLLELAGEEDEDREEAPKTPETKRAKSQARNEASFVKTSQDNQNRKDTSDVTEKKSVARQESRTGASVLQLTAEDQCKIAQSQHELLRKSLPEASITDLVGSETQLAKSKARTESATDKTSNGKVKHLKASEVIKNEKSEARPESSHGVARDPQSIPEDNRNKEAHPIDKMVGKSASSDCLTDVIVAEDEREHLGEAPGTKTAKPKVKASSTSDKTQSKEKKKLAKVRQSSTVTENGRSETRLTKKTQSKAKRSPASDETSNEKGDKKVETDQPESQGATSNPLLCNDPEKQLKVFDSKYKLLLKSASSDCVTNLLLGEEDWGEELKPIRADSKDKRKGKCDDSAQRGNIVKRRPKVHRTKSSCDVLGSHAERERTTSSGATAVRQKTKRSSGKTSKRRGVERSSNLLEKEQKGEGAQIHKEKRHSKSRRRPKMDRSVSVSCFRQATGVSEEKVSSSRKAASRLKRKAKLKKSSAEASSSSVEPPNPTMEASPSTASQTQKLPRSNSTPDVFVEPYPTTAGLEESTMLADEPSRRQEADLPQNSLKKTNSLPDLMQEDKMVDGRIADLSKPQRMSLSEACRLLKLNDTSLASLDLSDASIGDSGLETLSKAMENNWFLRELHLGRSGITHIGAVPLARSLRRNKTLERLYLQSNEIGDEGVEVLASAFAENQTLMVLNLARNSVGDIGTAALAEEISSSSRLQKLYLYENKIADIGASALGEIVKTCASLNELFIWDNAIGEKGAKDLRIALKCRQDKHPAANLHIRSSWKHEGIVAQANA